MITFVLHPGREKSLLRHHPWIFSKAVAAVFEQKAGSEENKIDKKTVAPGTLCRVADSAGNFLCYAHCSPDSQILLRAISFKEEDKIDQDFVTEKIKAAVKRRTPLILRGDHGIRLVAAEGDYLPGLIVDRFNQFIVIALTTWGMEALYREIVTALHQLFPEATIYERSDAKSRKKEQLPLRSGYIDPYQPDPAFNLKKPDGSALPGSRQIEPDSTNKLEAIPDTIYVLERDLVEIPIDIKNGHKTGGYLDQRQSRYHTYELVKSLKASASEELKAAISAAATADDAAAVGQKDTVGSKKSSGPSVLNCFCYTGGFGLFALKGGAGSVYNVDVSDLALNAARNGVVHNHLDPGRCKFINQDVFVYLRNELKKGTKFDVVILDPPKFIENKNNLVSGCRGYQDINRLALQLVRPGGHLLTFSCSGLMTEELFQKIIADAAIEAKVDAQLVAPLRQDIDHLVALPCPESFYLKGFDILVN